MMRCSEFEIRLCEYLDGTLEEAARREVGQHASECRACASLLADSGSLAAFLERVPAVEAPPELVTTVLYRTQQVRPGRFAAGWKRWLAPVLQPRFVMGMAMTILSFSMLSRVAGVKIRQLEAADMNPAGVWQGVTNQAHRVWDRGVKFYQNIRFIYEFMGQLRGLEGEEEPTAEQPTGGAPAAPPGDSRRLEPVKAGPAKK